MIRCISESWVRRDSEKVGPARRSAGHDRGQCRGWAELRLTLWRWKCQDWSRVPCPGIAVKTTLDAAQTVQYTALISGITKQVRPSDSTIDGWLLCFVLCVCVKSCISGPGHGAKYRPGQWPDIPETEVLQIFATLAADHGLNVLFQGQRRTRFWSHQVGVIKLQSVGVGNIKYVCRPGLYPDRGAAGRRPSAQHRRPGQGGVNSEQFGEQIIFDA